MRGRELIVVVGAVLALPSRATAADYVVSSIGDDSGPGTPGQPWLTIQKAAHTAVAGDVVTIEDGEYDGFTCDRHSGTADRPIVFKARNRWGAKIVRPPPGATGDEAQDLIKILSQSYIVLEDLEVSGAPRAGIMIRTLGDHTGFDTRGNVVRGCHCHSNGGTVIKGRHDGIFTGFAADLLIEDNDLHDNGEHGVYVSNSADNPVIRRNRSYSNGNTGIQINADATAGGDGVISGWLIEENVVYGNRGSAAINLDGVAHGVARNNLIHNNAKAGITLYAEDGAEPSHHNAIVNNTIFNPDGSRSALQVADGANDNIIFNNILYSGAGAGLEIQTVSTVTHDYNLVSRFRGASVARNERRAESADLFREIALGDFRLGYASPARDMGVAELDGIGAPDLALEGVARPLGRGFDIGCYEAAPGDQPPPSLGESGCTCRAGGAAGRGNWVVTALLALVGGLCALRRRDRHGVSGPSERA